MTPTVAQTEWPTTVPEATTTAKTLDEIVAEYEAEAAAELSLIHI